jgi:hypothetical protein
MVFTSRTQESSRLNIGGRRWAGAFAAAVLAAGVGLSAHVPLQPPGSLKAGVQISLNVGGVPLSVGGLGECQQGSDGSQARKWSARRRDGQREVVITVWRGSGGAEQFTLLVTINGRSHRVNTGRSDGAPTGSGQATFEAKGRGGVFNIYALADTGARISGQVSCTAFWRT